MSGYDFSAFKLPSAKGQPAPQSVTKTSPAPDARYDFRVFNLPGHGPMSTAAKGQPAPQSGNSPASDSGSRGYDFSSFHLPEEIEIAKDGKETETIEIRNFGRHVRGQVEHALNRSPQEGINALFRSIGAAQGSGLMAGPTLARFKELGQGFLHSKNPKLFFTMELVSFLNGLAPERRKNERTG